MNTDILTRLEDGKIKFNYFAFECLISDIIEFNAPPKNMEELKRIINWMMTSIDTVGYDWVIDKREEWNLDEDEDWECPWEPIE